MTLIIESTDEQTIDKIVDMIRPMMVTAHKLADKNTVGTEERKLRVAIMKKFKGCLGAQAESAVYKANKHEWYNQ